MEEKNIKSMKGTQPPFIGFEDGKRRIRANEYG